MEKFEKSLNIIESLLDAINWLGGDSYEIEATQDAKNEAYEFLKEYKPSKPGKNRNGVYCLRSDTTVNIEAMSKIKAALLLGVGKGKIKCLKQPKPSLTPNQ